jgi:hypothetical protein
MGAFKYFCAKYFCGPVYPGLDFALRWTHVPAIDQWVLRRSHAVGAVPAMALIVGLGGTMLGGIMLGWLSYRDAVFGAFLGMILLLCPFMIIRLGASLRLVVHPDGRTVRIDAVYAAHIRVEDVPREAVHVCRGTVIHPRYGIKTHEARAGLWLRFSAGPVILVSGSESDVDRYISTMPLPIRNLVQDSSNPLYVGFSML